MKDFAGKREQSVDAVQSCLFIAFLWKEMLGGDASEEFHVEIPGGSAVGVFGAELASGKAKIELETGESPFF